MNLQWDTFFSQMMSLKSQPCFVDEFEQREKLISMNSFIWDWNAYKILFISSVRQMQRTFNQFNWIVQHPKCAMRNVNGQKLMNIILPMKLYFIRVQIWNCANFMHFYSTKCRMQNSLNIFVGQKTPRNEDWNGWIQKFRAKRKHLSNIQIHSFNDSVEDKL